VAWAVYLVPKALEHHEASDRKRIISDFSHRVRVLGRREPAVAEKAAPALPTMAVPGAAESASAYVEVPIELNPAQRRARALARSRATKRRRTVLLGLLGLLVVVAAVALTGVVPTYGVAVPVVLLVAWLVACRAMVRSESAVPMRRIPVAPEHSIDEETAVHAAVPLAIEEDGQPSATDLVPVAAPVAGWDPVDVPLPTYVAQPAVRRTVRTIDLDSTGVWSSGRNESDSALARSADAARAEKTTEVQRKTGS